MCKGNYVFQPGDVVRRKLTAMDRCWCNSMKARRLDPEGGYIVAKAHLHDLYLNVNGVGAWDANSFDLVRRASTEDVEFQPGDVVRRKATELDGNWCSCIEHLGCNPNGDFIVNNRYAGSLMLEGGLGVWNTSCFDLVRRASTPVPDSVTAVIAADAIIRNAAAEMLDRAASRDTPEGERSMGRCVKAFNAMFGTELTETQGWQFMELLKMARSAGGEFRLDDFTDGVAYAALAGESEARLKQSV